MGQPSSPTLEDAERLGSASPQSGQRLGEGSEACGLKGAGPQGKPVLTGRSPRLPLSLQLSCPWCLKASRESTPATLEARPRSDSFKRPTTESPSCPRNSPWLRLPGSSIPPYTVICSLPCVSHRTVSPSGKDASPSISSLYFPTSIPSPLAQGLAGVSKN